MYEISTFVCFIYMQPQKLKFKSVQINMKHVSYIMPYFFSKLGKMLQNLSLAAVVIGALRVKILNIATFLIKTRDSISLYRALELLVS